MLLQTIHQAGPVNSLISTEESSFSPTRPAQPKPLKPALKRPSVVDRISVESPTSTYPPYLPPTPFPRPMAARDWRHTQGSPGPSVRGPQDSSGIALKSLFCASPESEAVETRAQTQTPSTATSPASSIPQPPHPGQTDTQNYGPDASMRIAPSSPPLRAPPFLPPPTPHPGPPKRLPSESSISAGHFLVLHHLVLEASPRRCADVVLTLCLMPLFVFGRKSTEGSVAPESRKPKRVRISIVVRTSNAESEHPPISQSTNQSIIPSRIHPLRPAYQSRLCSPSVPCCAELLSPRPDPQQKWTAGEGVVSTACDPSAFS
ncbi:hypothetical protein JZ751_001905 [Albula glossodonta]|uniref:Uncharacterized protein n=1 Tax=Albula glossodonta TaxID=121402 RepID=A0A8T2P8F2_9TELE|nr:hypothetical protein JZ751_001905 [Albula glossodonta]